MVGFTGSTGSDEAPPKPSRYPGQESVAATAAPQVSTYIVAQNPEVLVQLLRENERRGLNPSVYTTPANAFNTLAVDFDAEATNNSQMMCKSLPRSSKNADTETVLSDDSSALDESFRTLPCTDFAEENKDTLTIRSDSTNSVLTPTNSEVLDDVGSLLSGETNLSLDNIQVRHFRSKGDVALYSEWHEVDFLLDSLDFVFLF